MSSSFAPHAHSLYYPMRFGAVTVFVLQLLIESSLLVRHVKSNSNGHKRTSSQGKREEAVPK
eukprot:4257743-Amphidinium_carterae.1